jgi:NAD(P)H-hydrate epimerase
MKVVTAEEMMELDRRAREDLGIPSIILMENAGRFVAQEAAKLSPGRKISVICGKGNNGGDGFVAARYLQEMGFDPFVILIGKTEDVKHDPKVNIERLKVPINEAVDAASFEVMKPKIADSDLIIDAIFGIGLNTDLKSPYIEIVTWLNSLHKPILAVDVPSGLNATTGKIMGAAIKATKTITFAAAKTGFFKADGPRYVGEVELADIGIPV